MSETDKYCASTSILFNSFRDRLNRPDECFEVVQMDLGWKFQLTFSVNIEKCTAASGNVYLYPSFKYLKDEDEENITFGINYSIAFFDRSDPTKIESPRKGYTDRKIFGDFELFEDILADNNRFVMLDCIQVQLSMSIESLEYKGKPRMFDFSSRPFDYENKSHTICLELERTKGKPLYCHKQAILGSLFPDVGDISEGTPLIPVMTTTPNNVVEACLQIRHGVRLNCDDYYIATLGDILHFSQYTRSDNVIRYIESYLIFTKHQSDPIYYIYYASKYKMRRLLVHLLKRIESVQKLKHLIENKSLITESSECMKIVAARFFSFV